MGNPGERIFQVEVSVTIKGLCEDKLLVFVTVARE